MNPVSDRLQKLSDVISDLKHQSQREREFTNMYIRYLHNVQQQRDLLKAENELLRQEIAILREAARADGR